ncbi:MAG TPA: arsenate reductase [Candidatus Binatia bacterium]|jgi:arsenate reductase
MRRRQTLERNILFLCEDNACLSQMAEAAAKHLAPPRTRIFSAGVKPSAIPAHVVQAMQELGISMSGHRSKGLSDIPIQEIDLVVSFGDAHKQLSDLPHRMKIERWPIAGESRADTDTESALSSVRDRRDEIDKRVFALFLDHWRNAPKSS